jgi:[protein-PII] uridylyltransferase
VVEVNARDRAALLSALAQAVYQSRATIHSAHVATYGERAVDVFYVADFEGEKITQTASLEALRERLLKAAGDAQSVPRKAA